MADVSKVNVNSTDYDIKDSNAMHKGVDRVTAGQSIIAPIGTASTADGFSVNASGDYSHASGFRTIASSDMQHVIGKYNEEDANGTYAFIVGGGRLDFDRKNIFTIDWNGDVNAGRSNGLSNDTKLPTGADVISYLNSNLGKYFSAQSTTVVTMDAYVFYPILSLSLPAGVYIIVGSAREEGDGTGTSRRLLNINTVASFTTETPGTQTFSSFSPTHATTSLILSLNSQTTVYLNAFSDDNGAKVTHCYLRAVKLSP